MSGEEKKYFVEPGQSFEVDLFRPEDAEGVSNISGLFTAKAIPSKNF